MDSKILPEVLYNTQEVAVFLNTGRKYVYKLIHDRKIAYIKLDGEIYRVKGQFILDYLKNCEKNVENSGEV